MKVLYAIQGTGNGHLSRARDIIPILQQHTQLDVMVSGIQADVALDTQLRFKCKGMSFIFGKKGGVDIWGTYRKNEFTNFFKEVFQLPVEQYDLVINDFEPVSAWACKRKAIPCIGLSHQSAVIAKEAPRPSHSDIFGNFILKNYAPVNDAYGFHFKAFSKKIFTPVIRKQVRALQPTAGSHYTVYLPSYSDAHLIEILSQCSRVEWQVFSKHSKKAYQESNVKIRPIHNEAFIQSMVSATGVLCGAGFETPAEALYLGKKLMVIPMKAQYEQHCNAAALAQMGVPIINSLTQKNATYIQQWIENPQHIKVNFPNQTEAIIEQLLSDFRQN